MNYIFPIVRIVCGLVLVVVATTRYFSVRARTADADVTEVQVFGFTAAAESWQFTLAFGAAVVIGLALFVLGIVTLIKKIQEN